MIFKQTIHLGLSPCPNDCFIFDALIHHKIDTKGLTFVPYMGDVEDLNLKAQKATLDVTKLSFNAYFGTLAHYVLLNAGAALGKGCGPLLVSKDFIPLELLSKTLLNIGIPGKYTTANLLLSFAFPNQTNKTELLFSDIEDALISNKINAGLLIHENRFTYPSRGLQLIQDLGSYWESKTGFPIPLGGIAIRRSLPFELQQVINDLIQESVLFAFNDPASSRGFVKANAQAMDEQVMKQHIELYVNDYSVQLGPIGRQAIELLHDQFRQQQGQVDKSDSNRLFFNTIT